MPPKRTPRKPSAPAAAPRLLVRSSDIHAAGCYTLDAVVKGQRMMEYDGERLTKHAADLRYENRNITYLFGYGKRGDVIDGFGTAMFVNHSCAPNCETHETPGERIVIRAIRDIAAGEELLYSYHLYDSDIGDTADCYCGAPECRGTMYSEDEVKRRDRAIARKKRARKR
jgi:SET domain-containing protein